MNREKAQELEALIKRDYGNTAGMVVRKDGKTVYEAYFHGCTAASRLHVYSVTKSVVSLLLGIAIDKGYIKSIDTPVLDFFPEYPVKKGSKAIREITLRHLLTMTAPFRYKIPPYIKYFKSEDWVRFTLDVLGGRGQIGEFRYMPLIGPDLFSGILQAATGQPVLDFAKEHLFSPLHITVEKSLTFESKEEQMAFNKATNISGWAADPSGTNAAGWGLTLTAPEMADIGELMLNGGTWNGRQLVSSSWVQASTSEQSVWEKEKLRYGYLWWAGMGKGHSFAAMGDGGNVIYVNPEKKMVVAIASLFQPRVKDRIEFIETCVEPAFEDSGF